MILTEKRKLDLKNRINIPIDYIRKAGGGPNGEVYVTFDEETKKIEIIVVPATEETRFCEHGG